MYRSGVATVAEVTARSRAVLDRRGSRPLVVEGPSGAGKTTLLRAVTAEAGPCWWWTAADFAYEAAEAIRGARHRSFTSTLVADPRPLVIEHLEDLEGKTRTREELERALLVRAERGGATILTLTAGRGRAETLRWLSPWADIVSLEPRPPDPARRTPSHRSP